MLGNLQNAAQFETMEECLTWLRAWPRWIQRCRDLKMMVPDGSVLAKALTTTSARFVQAELESLIAAKPGAPTLLAKVKNLGASTTPSSTSAVNTSQGSAGSGPTGSGKGLCKYFFRAGGCRRASRCPFSHDMSHLSKAERAKRCLLCGGEEHRQKDCPTRQQRTTTKPAHQGGSSPGFAHQGQGSGGGREAAVRHAEPDPEATFFSNLHLRAQIFRKH